MKSMSREMRNKIFYALLALCLPGDVFAQHKANEKYSDSICNEVCYYVNSKYKKFVHGNWESHFAGFSRKKPSSILYECSDTIYKDVRGPTKRTNRVTPRKGEEFVVESGAYHFVEGDPCERRDGARFLHGPSMPEIYCSVSDFKRVEIKKLRFSPFIDSMLYPYRYHSEIERLELSAQGYIEFPNLLKNHTNLKELSIYDVGGWECIAKDLSIVTISDDLSIFPKLRSFQSTYLPISIENELYGMPELKYLWLEGNGLTEIPRGILDMKNLEVLILSYNPIEKLPDELLELKKLRILSLLGSKVTAEEAHRIADQMPNLKYLWHP